MESSKSLLVLLSVLLTVHGAVFDQSFERDLESFVENSMKCHEVPGYTLSVVKGGDVWSKGFGMANIAENKTMNSDTKIGIGSVTKSFTVTLLGILLAETGRDWTAKVTDILGPGYEFTDAYRTKEMMLRDLISHRTGLARLDYAGIIAGIPQSVSRAEFCKSLKYLPEQIPFRDGFIYNNYMVTMVGHVAEKLGQDTYENLLKIKVLQPLGMNNTSFLKDTTDFLQDNTAQPYLYVDGALQNGTRESYILHPLEPAGSILSTANDMAKWIKFHLSLGKTETGHQLINKEMMREIHQVTTPMTSYVLIRPLFSVGHMYLGYNYGMWTQEYRGYRIVGHDGSLASFQTLMWTFPELDIGLFASLNGPGPGTLAGNHLVSVFYHIADHLLGLNPWLNETTACTFPKPWLNRPPRPPTKLPTPINVTNYDELVGIYGSHIFPDINVAYNSTDLLFTSNKMHGILHPLSVKDKFVFEILEPMEWALHPNNTKAYLALVTFGRDSIFNTVYKLTFKFQVDVEYIKNPNQQIIG